MGWLFRLFKRHGPLTGRWVGYYVQHKKQNRIIADFVQRGSSLFGRMQDLDTYVELSLSELWLDLGLNEAEINRLAKETRSLFPDSPPGRIDYCSTHPSSSLIQGEISEFQISFTKRYEGYIETEYILNGLSIPQTTQCHLVEYVGTVNADQSEINGQWSIRCEEEQREDFPVDATIFGEFQLLRETAV